MRYGVTLFLELLLFTGSANIVTAQRQLFTTYAMNDGLVQNDVRDIFQDSKGFIWIGTWEGLSKYDGQKFTNYTTVNGLSHGMVNNIFESGDGNIYIACNDGSLDMVTNNERPKKFSFGNVVINRLKKLPNNKIVAATDHNGLYEFNEGKLLKPRQVHPGENYFAVSAFNDSLFIVQSDSSIEILNYRYELFAELRAATPLYAESGLLTDSKKRIWLGTQHGLKLISPVQEKGKALRFLELPPAFNLPVLRDNVIRDLLEDHAGNIWIGTFYGLVRIGADGSQQIITEKDGLPAIDVSRIFQDRESNIWIGGSHGIAKLVTKTNISTYTIDNGLLSNNVTSLLPFDDGNILVGSEKGLQIYDKTKRIFITVSKSETYHSGNDQNSNLSLVTVKKSGVSFLVFSQSRSNRLFFGPSSTGSTFAVKDDQGNFFFPGSSGTLFSHDFINWQKTLCTFDNRAILIDSKGNLWVGSSDSGLYRIRYDYVSDTPRLVRMDHYLPGAGIRSLYEDSKGYIWAGSRYNGIFRLDQGGGQTPRILHFDQSTGLTSNRITSIGEDKAGCIWVNFYHGLDKLIPGKDGYRVFNFSQFNNFFTNIQSMVFDNGHALWLATTEGLMSISDGKTEDMVPLKVYITVASLGDSAYRSYKEQKIELSHWHKQVQFEFAAPGFINEKQVLFSYRLLGGNNNGWSQPSNDHIVSYANLQPGNYRFEVKNKGWNGAWGDTTNFEFAILPPFWQTWWFITGVVLATAAVTYWVAKRRIKTVRRQGEMKQKISETEMMALRAQMNPHFIFNCLNSIDNLIQNSEKEKATTYLAKFARLIRAILENSKHNSIACWKDIETLELYLELEALRCDKKFVYQLTIGPEILYGDYKVPPLVIQPFVENAIHHGLMNKKEGNKELFISVRAENSGITYVVEDNGVGREKAAEYKRLNRSLHHSMGMQITLERIKLANRKNGSVKITDLYDDQRHPAGTNVEVHLINQS